MRFGGAALLCHICMLGTAPLRYCWRILKAGWERNMRYLAITRRMEKNRRESMSMHPQPIPAIPEETARVAHAILPRGNVWLQMRDEFGTLYEDHDFQDLFPRRGQPAEAPWCLALVTLMQYAE